MQAELLQAFVLFAFVALFTPGPNNAMLMASGLNYGWARSMPHMIGVALGFGTMALCVGVGLGALIKLYPNFYLTMKIAGAAYLLYLAWRIATAGEMSGGGDKRGRPFSFIEAAAFQWINPKAWGIAISATAAYAPREVFPLNVLLIAAIFAVIGIGSGAAWVMFGTNLRRWLKTPKALRAFNIVMALLLVASLYPVLADAL